MYLHKSYIYGSGTFVGRYTYCVRLLSVRYQGTFTVNGAGLQDRFYNIKRNEQIKSQEVLKTFCRSLGFIYSKFGGPNEEWRQKEFW